MIWNEIVQRVLPYVVKIETPVGYPAVRRYTQCFFSGKVSAFEDYRHAYLIDGVAIDGVSGGPVLYSTTTDGIQFVGSISAYIANRATGEALPGLSIAQDVSHLHEIVSRIRSIDEGQEATGSRSRSVAGTNEHANTIGA